MKKALCLLAAVLLLPLWAASAAEGGVSDTLYVKKVENLPDDFIFGMDVSSVIAEEESGVRYYDFDGQEKDLFEILSENGVTYKNLVFTEKMNDTIPHKLLPTTYIVDSEGRILTEPVIGCDFEVLTDRLAEVLEREGVE